MRLICPNCDAQYEVPDDVIPEDGRDVQCSNCGNTWFQGPASHEDAAPLDEVAATAVPEPDAIAEDWDADEPTAPESAPEPTPDPEPEQAPERRQLDPGIASVLQEEAEHEARLREAEQQALESQPELGLDEAGAHSESEIRAQQARDRMARLRGESPSAAPKTEPEAAAVSVAAAAASGSRREMLPDIEEINSTLRSSDTPRPSADGSDSAAEAAISGRKKGGARRGFVWIILLAVIAIAIYLYAEKIAETVPQAAEPLQSYVAFVDSARTWLDAKVLQGLSWLDGMTAESSGSGETSPETASE